MSHEMSETQRNLLERSRCYLLRNIFPSEEFWALLIKDIFTLEDLEDIKSHRTRTKQLTEMLDRLHTSGPKAFDNFCTVLLESNQSHVADHLVHGEAEESFLTDLEICDVPEDKIDRICRSFKRNASKMVSFARRKIQSYHACDDDVLQRSEGEIEQMQERISLLETSINQLEDANWYLKRELRGLEKNVINCANISRELANAIATDCLTDTFAKVYKDHIYENVRDCNGMNSWENIHSYYQDMVIISDYLFKYFKTKSFFNLVNFRVCSNRVKGKELSRKMDLLYDDFHNLVQEVSDSLDIQGNRAQIADMLNELGQVRDGVTIIAAASFHMWKYILDIHDEVLALKLALGEVQMLDQEIEQHSEHIKKLEISKQQLKTKRDLKNYGNGIKNSIRKKHNQKEDAIRQRACRLHSAMKCAETLTTLLKDFPTEGDKSRPQSVGSPGKRINPDELTVGPSEEYTMAQRDRVGEQDGRLAGNSILPDIKTPPRVESSYSTRAFSPREGASFIGSAVDEPDFAFDEKKTPTVPKEIDVQDNQSLLGMYPQNTPRRSSRASSGECSVSSAQTEITGEREKEPVKYTLLHTSQTFTSERSYNQAKPQISSYCAGMAKNPSLSIDGASRISNGDKGPTTTPRRRPNAKMAQPMIVPRTSRRSSMNVVDLNVQPTESNENSSQSKTPGPAFRAYKVGMPRGEAITHKSRRNKESQNDPNRRNVLQASKVTFDSAFGFHT